MRPLSAQDLLEIWELGEEQHPLDRALTILAAACPELTWDELASLSIGQRDARLLALRERTYGQRLESFVECPQCSESLEFEMMAADLRASETAEEHQALELASDGFELRFRLPDSLALAAVLECPDLSAARERLVQRCVLEARRGGTPVAGSELPADIAAELSRSMSEHDPQAEVLIDLRCPSCRHRWQALFDIVTYFWTELSAQAQRLLREVHTLALAYGWHEADILGMSTRRRQFYLEMTT
jgi:hypothetical protein